METNVKILLKNSALSYYWMGFLLADGSFSDDNKRLLFSLAKKDEESVKSFSNYIKTNYHYYNTTTNFGKSQTAVTSVMDKVYVPKICKKFNIVNNKTCNPPDLSFIKNDRLLTALIIGFIDGDGSINKIWERNDSSITIECHGSWFNNLSFFEESVYRIFCVKKYKMKSLTKINKKGYALLRFSDSRIINALKRKTIKLDLPVLSRKWNVINENRESIYATSHKRRKLIKQMSKNGKTITEMSRILGITHGAVIKLKKTMNRDY